MQSFGIGGLERMVQTLATGLQAEGHEAHVAAYLEEGPIAAELARAGVVTHSFVGAPGLRATLTLRLARWLRSGRFDVLHTHHVGPAIYGGPAARLAGVRHVHTDHSVEFYDVGRRRLLGAVLPRVARVVGVSEAISDWRRQAFGTRCTVIENGVEPVGPPQVEDRRARRSELQLPDDAWVVGCVARLAREKNHELLLEAARRWEALHLVFIGDGPRRAALEAEIARLGLTSRVRLLGARDDVRRWWCAFDVATLTSTREGQPMALLEAMSAEVPVVATGVGGVPQLLAGAGLVVPPGDATALVSALQRLQAPTEYARCVAAGRRVAELHSANKMVRRYLALYAAALRQAA